MSEPALRRTGWVVETTGLSRESLEVLATDSLHPVPGKLRVRRVSPKQRHKYWVVADVLLLCGISSR